MILIAIGIFIFYYANKNYEYSLIILSIGFLVLVIGFIILFYAPLVYLDYVEFEIEYEVQREMLANYNLPENKTNLTYIIDLLEINQKLTKYQASRLHWG